MLCTIQHIESIYQTYHKPEYLTIDPLVCVRRVSGAPQREIAALVAAVLSYGRVEQIIAHVDQILGMAAAATSLVDFSVHVPLAQKRKLLRGFKHRFNDGTDMALLFECVGRTLKEYGSLEKCFGDTKQDMASALHDFSTRMKKEARRCERNVCASFDFLFPSPVDKSACKRLAMFTRWMIRPDDGIDLGLWKSIERSSLIIPVDTHVARIAQSLNLTARTAADWRMAEEITTQLKKVDPADPVKYDFSLCRFGMVGASLPVQRAAHKKRKGTR